MSDYRDYCIKLEDAVEDTSILFALSRAQNSLGHASLGAQTITLTVREREYTVLQDPDYLRRSKGVTGSVVWNATPVLLTHLLDASWFPGSGSGDSGESENGKVTLLELGSGVGFSAMVLGPLCDLFVASDHDLRLLHLIQHNTRRHLSSSSSTRGNKLKSCRKTPGLPTLESGGRIEVLQIDWNDDGRAYLPLLNTTLARNKLDWILCLDCVYSAFLANALATCLRTLAEAFRGVKIIIGQQLREQTVHAEFIHSLLSGFDVWRVPSPAEMEDEGDGRHAAEIDGFAIYIATLKPA